MKPRVQRAVVAGVIATLVTTAMMVYVSPRIAGSAIDLPAMLGAVLGGSWVAGLIAHLAIGILLLPVLYVWAFRWLMGTPLVRGLIAGLLLWLVSQLLIGPVMGAGPFSAYVGGIPAAIDSLLLHLTYGALLGSITGRPPRSSDAWMHPTELEAHWRRARWLHGGATTHWRVR